MVNMGMGQKNEVDFPRIEREVPIIQLFDRFRSLKKTAIDEKLTARMNNPITGTGDIRGSAAKGNINTHVNNSFMLQASNGAR